MTGRQAGASVCGNDHLSDDTIFALSSGRPPAAITHAFAEWADQVGFERRGGISEEADPCNFGRLLAACGVRPKHRWSGKGAADE